MNAHSYSAKSQVYTNHKRNLFAKVDVSFTVPDRIAALLPEAGGVHFINSATMAKGAGDIAQRARSWNQKFRDFLPLRDFCARSIAEGCTEEISIRISPEEWHFIGVICGRLHISPGDWLLGCATYNADLEEQRIESRLAALPSLAESEAWDS